MKDLVLAGDFDLGAARDAIRGGATVTFAGIDVVATQMFDRQVFFAVDIENDPIQRNHRLGQFYESRELSILKRYFPLGGVFVDVGANVGNHGLYAALFLGARQVIPVEPNPRAYRLLLANVVLNTLADKFVLDHLGLGLSDADETGFAVEERDRNIGAAKLLPGSGDVDVRRGDAILAGIAPDVIKIDVEAMEMKALSGLEETISRCRPAMLIEVDQENYDAFEHWCADHEYETADSHQRYRTNKNFAVLPKERRL